MMALPMFRTCRAVCHLIKRPGCYWSLRLSAEKRNCFVPFEWSRHYCSQGDDISKNKQKVVVVGIPNPFIWFRTRIYYFLIRAYFDQEFRIDEFSDGAKQMLEKIKEKCRLLPTNHLQALAADLCDIMYSTPGDIGIYYDDNGRKFVSILMRFWYLTSAHIPEETPEGSKVFQVVFRDEGSVETRKLITANYEFQREFTQGVAPDWTITRIEHSRLLD
ncbi:m-AAA protease-interacting protein 1, mitochondrial isoform X2 [Erpetoichthys calabaricus]|uniref:m-AAA protease-interacting protein 1, mitochondrial isoform X2 n=1 Tax=Erpetoichthys calabaricus TaxID=27687 RepID=UPI00223497BB|nr:m-AAA protease-interacting protein 1, mitochondrial isoform X2 [Erpetoichthys calabaricus]